MHEIILVRHAKVEIDSLAIPSAEMKEFLDEYNHAPVEISKGSDTLDAFIHSADVLLTSELIRSKESLKNLGKEADESAAVFNEAELPYANGKRLKLSGMTWTVIFRVMWLLGYANHSESYKEAKLRAKKATDKLIEHTQNNKKVLLVGHGIMNRLITKELKLRGFTLAEKTGDGNLGYMVLRKERI